MSVPDQVIDFYDAFRDALDDRRKDRRPDNRWATASFAPAGGGAHVS